MNMFQTLKLHPIQPALLGVALILSTGGCSKSVSKADAQPNAKLEAMRQAGDPVTLVEFNGWYAEPPAAENAASLYLEAFAALAPPKAASPALLAQTQKALDILHQAALRKKCRYPVDLTKGANAVLSHLAGFGKAAQLLAAAAASHAAKGQMELAAQSLLDGLLLARSLQEEPLVLSRVHQIATLNTIQRGLESVLNRNAFSEEQLARLQAAFGEAENGVSLARPLAGERCIGIAVFQWSSQEEVEMFAKVQHVAGHFDLGTYRKSPAYTADFNSYLDLMEKGITLTALPFEKSLEGIGAWTAGRREAQSKGCHLSELLLPALDSALERAAQCAGRLRMAQAALAVERYRLANRNALPESFAQLAPQFLAEVPADPFDGQPLRYKKLPSAGFVVEGAGKDGNEEIVAPKPAGASRDAGYEPAFVVAR